MLYDYASETLSTGVTERHSSVGFFTQQLHLTQHAYNQDLLAEWFLQASNELYECILNPTHLTLIPHFLFFYSKNNNVLWDVVIFIPLRILRFHLRY